MQTCTTCGKKLDRSTTGDLCGVHYREARMAPMPTDLAEHIAEPIADLCVRYSVGRKRLKEWIAASGLERENRKYRPPERPIPADFADNINLTERQLAAMYEANTKTVRRWRNSLGFTPPARIKRDGPRKVAIKHGVTAIMGAPKLTGIMAEVRRDDSIAGRAARHLQKWGPVYRHGGGWMRGSTLLNDNELIERAVAKGFAL